jgi:hypothetical protein
LYVSIKSMCVYHMYSYTKYRLAHNTLAKIKRIRFPISFFSALDYNNLSFRSGSPFCVDKKTFCPNKQLQQSSVSCFVSVFFLSKLFPATICILFYLYYYYYYYFIFYESISCNLRYNGFLFIMNLVLVYLYIVQIYRVCIYMHLSFTVQYSTQNEPQRWRTLINNIKVRLGGACTRRWKPRRVIKNFSTPSRRCVNLTHGRIHLCVCVCERVLERRLMFVPFFHRRYLCYLFFSPLSMLTEYIHTYIYYKSINVSFVRLASDTFIHTHTRALADSTTVC